MFKPWQIAGWSPATQQTSTVPIHQAKRIEIADGELLYYPQIFDANTCSTLLQELQSNIQWTTRSLTLFGKTIPMPRLLAWHADPGIHYRYSGGDSPHNDWTPTLRQIQHQVEKLAQSTFNGALLNLYRDGQHSMGWHSDNEATLGPSPVIASVSLGAEREFQLRHKLKKYSPIKLTLESGSLLLMRGALQQHWQHQLPKTQRAIGPRINITFRHIIS